MECGRRKEIHTGLRVDNTKMDLKYRMENMDWTHLAQDKNQWRAAANDNEPPGSIKYRE
jgi:hypothetical protein